MALEPNCEASLGGSGAFDHDGRPILQEHLARNYQGPSAHACNVLYSLALTELRGNKLGLTKRSMLNILLHPDDLFAGTWDWLVTPRPNTGDLMTGVSFPIVRNAVRELLETYPFVVLKRGKYVPVPAIDRSKGGALPDVYVLNSGAIERWPCAAHVITVLATRVHAAGPITYETLTEYVPKEHSLHHVPEALRASGAKQPRTHTLHEDIDFLARTRYLKLYHPETTIRKKEIPYCRPLPITGDTILELDDRALWEQPYLQKLSQLFAH